MAAKIWKNWSGLVQFKPNKVQYPASHNDIVQLVKKSAAKNERIRVIGSGHSWNPLYETDQTLVSLDDYQGIESVDREKMQVRVYAGTKIKKLGELLFQLGLGMENLGDIDVQSIAGAISTGTHGTGISLGNIPTQVVALSLVTANGETLECSPTKNPDMFKAAQVSLGVLGIISKITLQCVPAYKLHYQSGKENVDTCLAKLEDYNASTRNFEFYWFPHTETVQTKFSNITTQAAKPNTFVEYANDLLLENGAFGLVSLITRIAPSTSPQIANLCANLVSPVSKVNWSHRVYATQRLVRFNEMEYNVPIESFKEVFLEIKDMLERKRFQVHFPTENRFLKGDDIYLSPAYGRDSAHISLHVFKGKAYQPYFDAMESIFRNHKGRPHWGKLHTLSANELAPLYPMWAKFCNIRKTLDPKGLFMNGYLRQLFGVTTMY